MARAPRTSRGRQKVKMAKMTKEANRAVTFSKRRYTAYKSASELCTLTGAEVALIVFSPGNKACSFGSPGVHSVIDRYLSNGFQLNKNPMEQLHRMIVSENLNEEVTSLENVLEQEKERAQVLDNMINERKGKYWWDAPAETLDLHQLEQLRTNLQNLCTMIESQVNTGVRDLQDYCKTTADFGVPQNGILPSNLNGGISIDGASSSTMPQSIQMDYLGLPSTNFGVSLQYSAGSSIMQGDAFIDGGSLSNQMAISTMAAGSSNQMGIPSMGANSSNQTVAASSSNQMAVSTVAASSTDQMVISTVAESSLNQMATFDANQKESATVGVLEHAGPSRFNIDSQPNFGDPVFTYGNNPYDDDDDWLKLLLGQI